MAQQNIYDNEIFFEGYKKIRDNEVNANNLFEIPALFSMMPELKGKRVLDLGCLLWMGYLYFHKKIHYVRVIQEKIDGRETKMEISYI